MSPNNRNMSQEEPIPTESLNHAGAAISRIESIMESVIDKLLRHEPMSIALASRRSLRRRQNQTSSRQVDFPGRSAQEAQRFGITVP
ncbi:hypothetical protein VFPPC_16312 [Pochonia chlamydosporia 170]|uniref:Uncharacterized protein n=1 Tax=Pochonia chlamydosporia 170 TaxID=1380566 RepID=A0A179FIQ2_METCM|nr:hypothetical protein VFPPC_16312 [Pochonia chlamydosporia 170]OAQ65178.1 hypothetical protein VFPPC_16312 [Pochonia chlamydosporia 170]